MTQLRSALWPRFELRRTTTLHRLSAAHRARRQSLQRPSTIDTARAEAMLAAMIGEYVWWSRTGEDAILRMDFGVPRLRVREPLPTADRYTSEIRTILERRLVVPTGRWHLFVEAGDWKVGVKERLCCRQDVESADASRQARVVKCLSVLDGQKLKGVARSAEDGVWRFTFDLDGIVSIGDGEGQWDAAWTMFLDDGSNLSWMRDHTFSLEEGTSRG